MENKYLVRIVKSELFHFKNVIHGEIKYNNYGAVEKSAEIQNNDIVGIYGQNGSGKTAIVEALDILKHILSGEEIPYDIYAGLLDDKYNSTIDTCFFIQQADKKFKVKYEVTLKANNKEKKINLISEVLTYWRREDTWKNKRNLMFENPCYNPNFIFTNKTVEISSKHIKYFQNMDFIRSLQQLALYCAQKQISIFFNDLIINNLSTDDKINTVEELSLSDIISGLFHFGQLYFQVVKVNQLGVINKNDILPVNMHSESEHMIMQGCLPLVMDGHGEIPESLFEQLKSSFQSINIALKAIIPNLEIALVPINEEVNKDGEKVTQVEVYSVRDGHKFLTKYESEGIKRIISLLNYLISLYNYPEMCLVVDELDSGIFEYLLGELLGVLNTNAKGQLIFTSHNLRALEKLDTKSIVCSTTNPENRYIRLTGVEKNHNPRDFYIRAIQLGGQKESLYDEMDLQSIGYAFRRACNAKEQVHIHFSENFREKLRNEES